LTPRRPPNPWPGGDSRGSARFRRAQASRCGRCCQSGAVRDAAAAVEGGRRRSTLGTPRATRRPETGGRARHAGSSDGGRAIRRVEMRAARRLGRDQGGVDDEGGADDQGGSGRYFLGETHSPPMRSHSIRARLSASCKLGAYSRNDSAGEHPRTCTRCWVSERGPPLRNAAPACLHLLAFAVAGEPCARSRGCPEYPEEAVETMHKNCSSGSEVIRA
jgi:hypothetical protein